MCESTPKPDPDSGICKYWTEVIGLSAQVGDIDAVKALLASGVDVNTFDEDIAMAPLHFAAEAGHMDMVRLLLDAGADPNLKDESRIGDTPLSEAAPVCTLEMAKLLTDAGADPRIPGWMQLTALDRAKDRTDEEGQRVFAHLKETAQRLSGA